jgi:hexosaminidase
MAWNALVFLFGPLFLSHVSHVLAVWPLPRSIETGSVSLKLDKELDVALELHHHDAPRDLLDAISTTKHYIRNDRHRRLVVSRGLTDKGSLQSAPTMRSLVLKISNNSGVRSIMDEAVKPLGTRDEAYHMFIPSDGSRGEIIATSTLGLYRGLTTFAQLWYEVENEIYTVQAPIVVSDSPAYVSTSDLVFSPLSTSASAVPRVHARHGTKLVRLKICDTFIAEADLCRGLYKLSSR